MRPSRRPALKASEIPPQNLNLREGERQSIVCPDCDSWHPLYRKMIKTHHLDREVRGGRAPRCPGSAQLIDMDISVEQWGERMLAADSTATGRRSARQHYKPLAQPPTPIYRLADRGPQGTPTLHRLLPLLEHARHAVDQHRTACSLCKAGGRCDAGRALEVRAAETEASCTIAREQLKQQEHRRFDRAAAPVKRQAEWAAVLLAVQDADTRRAVVPAFPARPEAPAQAEVPSVPTEPEDIKAYDRRQAELGKQYARLADQPA
ncbi:hypothetical protein A6E92_31825 (plasmid) [Streptomyces sp. S8]|uniref:hypothetical protein n=1 Tax=Streptomyces sp. S8 TaxID=1837283 RepID=UPI000A09196D|nr:hypothetical protein [Streptomyces sp. S8]ARI56847.1 hypothetical protein A6E92_31825 [Streptomyces sp. S8]